LSDIFEEVEESLAHEKTAQLWKKFWPLVMTIVVGIIAAVAANSYLDHRNEQSVEEAGKAFEKGLKAIEAEDLNQVRSQFGEAMDSNTGFHELSAHYLAGAELRLAGDEGAALAALEKAAEEGGALGDLARLKAAYLKSDSSSLAEVEAYVAPLMKDGNSFSALARELIAAKALEEGDFARARSEYNFLTLSMDATSAVQQRASLTLSVLPTLMDNAEATATVDTPEEQAASDTDAQEEVTE
tara:strand:- start:884 stop:1609 length:726 start_codon:yes stop_codon:yes gene_type:complete